MERPTLVSRRLYKILYLNYYYSIKAFSYCFVKILKFRIYLADTAFENKDCRYNFFVRNLYK